MGFVDNSIVTPITVRKAVIAVISYGAAGLLVGLLAQHLNTADKMGEVGTTTQLAVSMFAIWMVIIALIARVSGHVWQGGLNTMSFFGFAVLSYYLAMWQSDEPVGLDWRVWGLVAITLVPAIGIAISWASLPSHPGWGWAELSGPLLAVPIGTLFAEALVLNASRHIDHQALLLADLVLAAILALVLPRTWPARLLAVLVAIPIAFAIREFWDHSYLESLGHVRDWVGITKPFDPGLKK